MVETKEIMCSQVYGALEWLGSDYRDKLPDNVKDFIEEYRDKGKIYTYDKTIELAEQEIGKRAVALLCILHYKYWCESQEERDEIKKILKQNGEAKKKKFLDYDEMFDKNKEEEIEEDIEKEETSLKVVSTADKWYSKIWNFVCNIFKRK